MFKTILVPTDGSELSAKAVKTAVEFASQHGARLVFISVAEPYPYTGLTDGVYNVPDFSLYERQMQDFATRNVEEASRLAAAAGVQCESVMALSFNPYEEIVKAAAERGCDAIFMASHGRKGLSRLVIGSETQKVLAHTTLPVMVLR
jgi:nucleotide-binding universal stress UspA family protein